VSPPVTPTTPVERATLERIAADEAATIPHDTHI